MPDLLLPNSGRLPALSLRPPWGTAVARWGKNIENRGLVRPGASLIGRALAIHQGKHWGRDEREAAASLAEHLDGFPTDQEAHAQGVVAVCRIAGYIDTRTRDERGETRGRLLEHDGGVAEVVGFADPADARAALEEALASPWWFGPIGWLLADVRPVEPVLPVGGKQGIWRVPDSLHAELHTLGIVPWR